MRRPRRTHREMDDVSARSRHAAPTTGGRMMRRAGVVIAAALLGAGWAGTGAAQQDTARVRPTGQPGQPAAPVPRTMQGGTPNYDVILEVPDLSVDSIGLTVANLQAHLALSA